MIRFVFIFIVFLLLIVFSWRNIISNISTNLPNWSDELMIIWVYQNNIKHFSQLDFNNFYETNAIYPFKYTLSFAEHMYFQSLLILLVSFFISNVITQYNILLLLNHLLIFITSLILFRKIFKTNIAALFSAFYFSYSPYFFIKFGHFQMIFFWPFLLSLYFLLDYFESKKTKSLLLSSIFAGLQFLSSVYLGIMNIAALAIYYVVEVLYKKSIIIDIFKKLPLIIFPFLLMTSVSIVGYVLVNREYSIKRDYKEFVTYSAHLTDYIFPAEDQHSLIYLTPIFKKLGEYNYHGLGEYAVFPGILASIFAVYAIFPKLKISKKILIITLSYSKTITFSLLLIATGFILSLGPKLFINGIYTQLPLPYAFLLKTLPLIGITRAVARWHFLVILGFAILLGLGYIKFIRRFAKNHKIRTITLSLIISLVIILEYYHIEPFPSIYKNWQNNPAYTFLNKEVCSNPETSLLEYPFHYRNWGGDNKIDVKYMAEILLQSTQHKCKILSGYWGYEPPAYLGIKNEFGNGFSQKDIEIIKRLKINYIKFNKFAISKEEYQKLNEDQIFDQFTKIYDDEKTMILKVT